MRDMTIAQKGYIRPAISAYHVHIDDMVFLC